MTLVTLFTTPKPFTNDHIAVIQRNALRSWLQLGADVEVLLIGEETGMAETARELGIRMLPDVQRNASGTPLISSIFDLAQKNSASTLLAYINTDILLMPDFLASARAVLILEQPFLVIGRRWDLDVQEELAFDAGWETRLRRRLETEAALHRPAGSDYFLYRRGDLDVIPPFAVGRAGWDNWMICHARRSGWPVVDATQDVTVIHQSHDYSHLPGGQPHYKLPETDENIRLAGGRAATRFTLLDANRRLVNGHLLPRRWTFPVVRRAVEAFPFLAWNDPAAAERITGIFRRIRRLFKKRK